MFQVQHESLKANQVQQYQLMQNKVALSFSTVMYLWQTDHDFRSFFLTVLRDCAYESYRFETPPVMKSTLETPFEFVLVNSPGLAPYPDVQAFLQYFVTDAQNDGVVAFENLGGDAQLIVPCPQALESVYPHLASFVRGAPEAQQHSLLRYVGNAMQDRLSQEPLWLNTAGGGVSWLHVRLDNRPKYYRFEPYRRV